MTRDEIRRNEVKDLEPVRKALVIQGSPRGERGYTEVCLQRFLEGVREGGVDTEVIYLHKHKINPCTGCFACWVKTPGVCIHKDDMPPFLEKISDADLIIWAQPLYIYSVPGITKNFMDRCLPLAEPWLIGGEDGSTNHPRRVKKKRRIILLSVAGFPELDHFKPLVETFRWWNRSGDNIVVGELLRPTSEAMGVGDRLGPAYQQAMDAFYSAGKESVGQGYVSQATEQRAATPFFRDPESLRTAGNANFKASIEYYEAKRQGRELPPIQEYMDNNPAVQLAGMAATFNPDKAGDLEGIIQFDVSGELAGQYFMEIKSGRCLFNEGKADKPDLTIHTPWEVWQAIGRGQISGQDALTQGKHTVEGDINLLIRMGELFGS